MSVFVFTEARTALGRFSLLFLCFGVPLVFSTRLEDGFELPQTLGALLALSFLLLMCRRRDWIQSFKTHWVLYLCGLSFLGTGIYSFTGLTQEVLFYFPAQNYLWILTALLFLAPLGFFSDKRKCYSFLVLSGFLGSLYACLQSAGVDFAGWNTRFGGRSFSTLGNPTFWAGQSLVLFPLAVFLALSARGKKEAAFWFGAAGLLTVGLLLTQTRGAWLAYLGELVLLVILTRRQSGVWKGLMLGLIAFLLALLAVPALNSRAVSLARIRNADAQGRYFLWKAAVSQWNEKKVWGQGPGGFAGHFTRTQAEISESEPFRPYGTAFHAHEDYLELLAERGAVGVLLALLILLILVRRRLRKSDPAVFSMATAELAVLFGVGVHSLFHFPFSVVPTACAMAILFNPSWDQGPGPPSQERPLWNEPRFFLGAGLFILCGLGMEVFAENFRLHQAADLANRQRYEEALRSLDLAPSPVFFHYLDPRVLKQRAALLSSMGKEGEAVPLWERASLAYPHDADAYAMLCMLYGKQGNWERARAYGMKSLELSPCHEQALNNLAVVAFLEGRKKEAILFLERLEQAQKVWGREADAEGTRRKIKWLEKGKKEGPRG